ncbi:PTS sugar transporter subunit IIA [Nakamurella flava]|uniref:PTS sugar transporter subunit IIA n=1 Tax=Nakamurella flava TaxID=2576308 RepID=UPI003B8452B2
MLAPVRGRAVALSEVPDPTFAEGIVGSGAAVDPVHEVLDAVAPISGKIFKLMPHAYIILGADNTGVLVHLGLDTVQLGGQGFTTHVAEGDHVEAGQTITTYDVPAIIAAGKNPIVPVVVMDTPADAVRPDSAVTSGAELAARDALFTVER